MLHFQSPPSYVSQKIPVNEPPLGSPTGAHMERGAISTAFFYTSLKFLMKVLLIKKNFTLLQKPSERRVPPCSPKWGPYGNRCPGVVLYVNTLGNRCGRVPAT